MLDPTERLWELESIDDHATKLGLLEEMKSMPFGAVWNMFCLYQNVPVGTEWMNDMQEYDKETIMSRT